MDSGNFLGAYQRHDKKSPSFYDTKAEKRILEENLKNISFLLISNYRKFCEDDFNDTYKEIR